MIGLLSLRLAQGPIDVDWLRPSIVAKIERDLPGSHATIKHLDLVWFPDARAVGFRFADLIIEDSHNRIIARAAKVETALAADSLALAHFAPARLTAEDFFVAVSVSEQGKYELGYDAHGAPGAAAGLDQIIYDLTSHEVLGHPASFVRQASLSNGQLHLVQEDGLLNWTAQVRTIDFTKLNNRLVAHVDLAIDSQGRLARVKADAQGVIGLKSASIAAVVHGLVPSKVFPAGGITHLLSRIDAPLDGVARVDYSAKTGFDNASVDLKAGSGHVDLGGSRQDFDGAAIRATYASAQHTIVFSTFQLKAHLIDTDLSGKVVVTPENARAKRDLSLAFDFAGPRVTGRLADDFSPQTLTQARLKGSFTPRLRLLKYETLTGLLDGTPFESQGSVYTDDKGMLGADLTAKIKGHFSKDEVFAFWPQHLSPITREDLIRRIKGGDYENADFVLKAPPGAFEPDQLQDSQLRLDFDFSNLGLEIEHRMKEASGLKGHGILLGNSFRMDVTAGRLVDVVLTKGALDVPSFHDHSTHTHIWLESVAPAVAVIEAVDPLADGQLAKHGLNKDRLSGDASVRVDIDFPTFQEINDRTFSVKFDGTIKNAGLKNAALGWDLGDGDLTVSGDLLANRLEVKGPAKLGPYTGGIDYRTQFVPKQQYVDFAGSFNAAQFGGSPRVPVPITGHFTLTGGKGEGTVDAAIFRGNVSWQGGDSTDERPTSMVIDGVTLSDGMEGQGLPVFEHLERELPTRIDLLRSGDIWSGEVQAESLSGDIAYIQGQRPRLVYTSIITPDEAQQLGYGALPMFKIARHLTVNVALDPDSKEALLKLDNMNATLGWSAIPNSDELQRRLAMKVQPEDWATLGLPVAFFQPKAPVNVTALWSQTDTELSGTVDLLGQSVAFTMPIRRRVITPGTGEIAPPPPLPVDGDDYDLRVTGDVTKPVLDALGYSQTPVRVGGMVGLVFSLYSVAGQPAAVLNLDATQAELGVRATDWKKPAGEPAAFAFSFDSQKDARGTDLGGVNVSRIYGSGDHVRIDGRASFDANGKLQFADFSNVYLKDFIDVTFKYYALEDRPASVMSISGNQLDLRPWLEANKEETGSSDPVQTAVAVADRPAGRPTHFVVDLAQLQTSAEGSFSHIKVDLNWDGKNGIDGEGTASTINGSPMAMAMKSEGDYSLFSLKAADIGDVIRTESGINNIKGGVATIEGAYRDGQIDADVRGEKARVKQLPVLAQLLTLASLEGLADTLTGDGIAFSDFDFPLRYKDHVVFIKDGWARGGAIGINVWGTTDTDAKTMKLNGNLIPAYGINGIFGDVRTHGLGLVGLKYDVGGTFKTPQVAVNPLSLILPGFLKVWANSERKDAIPALDVPSNHDKMAQVRDEADKVAGN